MKAGDELLRSYLGATTTQPLPQREEEMEEAGWSGLEASSARGVLESQVSENVRAVLQVCPCVCLCACTHVCVEASSARAVVESQVSENVRAVLQVCV